MEAIISITLIALVVILGSFCFWLHLIIKHQNEGFYTVREKVWKLQDKYQIPDEEIRACFYPDIYPEHK